jgi:D-beta-D-heptose 7-phosphate kinase/D-beta-D-heptose 1-phosphate adenosyltransferase
MDGRAGTLRLDPTSERRRPVPPAKIRSRSEAAAWRGAQTGRVVFTNGVFDLLHAGHVAGLEAARALGDALVVGVNDDASAARLGKGPGRPFVPLDDRLRVLAALSAVDCVVPFPEDTPEALIAAIEPDVLVKGSDYDPTTLPGREHVLARGGVVTVLPLLPDRSTSALVERIRATA